MNGDSSHSVIMNGESSHYFIWMVIQVIALLWMMIQAMMLYEGWLKPLCYVNGDASACIIQMVIQASMLYKWWFKPMFCTVCSVGSGHVLCKWLPEPESCVNGDSSQWTVIWALRSIASSMHMQLAIWVIVLCDWWFRFVFVGVVIQACMNNDSSKHVQVVIKSLCRVTGD